MPAGGSSSRESFECFSWLLGSYQISCLLAVVEGAMAVVEARLIDQSPSRRAVAHSNETKAQRMLGGAGEHLEEYETRSKGAEHVQLVESSRVSQ